MHYRSRIFAKYIRRYYKTGGKKTKMKLKEVGNTQLKRIVNSINHSLYIYKFMINCLLIVDIKKPTISQTDKSVFVCLRLEIDFLF